MKQISLPLEQPLQTNCRKKGVVDERGHTGKEQGVVGENEQLTYPPGGGTCLGWTQGAGSRGKTVPPTAHQPTSGKRKRRGEGVEGDASCQNICSTLRNTGTALIRMRLALTHAHTHMYCDTHYVWLLEVSECSHVVWLYPGKEPGDKMVDNVPGFHEQQKPRIAKVVQQAKL